MRRLAIATLVAAACGESTPPVPLSNRLNPELRPRAEDHGAIQGVVVDWKTSEALAGVTVIATSPIANHVETAITDENGAYKIVVSPGDWLVTFYYADLTVERPRVHVNLDGITPVSLRLHQ